MNKFLLLIMILVPFGLSAASKEKESLLPGIEIFVEQVAAEVEGRGIDWNKLRIDHLTYVAASVDEYLILQNKLKSQGSLVLEPTVATMPGLIVNKRAQTSFNLYNPITIAGQKFSVIEIACPWPKSHSQGYFEQIKLLVDTDVDQFANQYSHIPFNLKERYRAGNPEISLDLKLAIIRFRQMALADRMRSMKGVVHHPEFIATTGTLSSGILSDQQRQNLLIESSEALPFSSVTVEDWTLSLKQFKEPSECRMNRYEVLNALCLSGKVKVEVGATIFILGPGDSIQIPPGIVYRFSPIENFKPKVLFSEIL